MDALSLERGASLHQKRVPLILNGGGKNFSKEHSPLNPITLSFFIPDGTSTLGMTGGYASSILPSCSYGVTPVFVPSFMATPFFAPPKRQPLLRHCSLVNLIV